MFRGYTFMLQGRNFLFCGRNFMFGGRNLCFKATPLHWMQLECEFTTPRNLSSMFRMRLRVKLYVLRAISFVLRVQLLFCGRTFMLRGRNLCLKATLFVLIAN